MRQHVNPLSKNFNKTEFIPPLSVIYDNPNLPLHLDIGCAGGHFLYNLALENRNWNYMGIEIRQKLINNAKLGIDNMENRNLYFVYGNANNILRNSHFKFIVNHTNSISFNFPDPWFKKRHQKRRVIQPELINILSNSMRKGSLIYIKTDVKDLFDYMDLTISKDINFKQLQNNVVDCKKNFNPSKLQTNREKYVTIKELNVYEKTYIRV